MSTADASSLTGTSKRRKRAVDHHGSGAEPAAAQEARLAPFRSPGVEPRDIRVWPMKSEIWLDAEFGLVLPKDAGVRIERRFFPPAPGFQPVDVPANRGRVQFETACEFAPRPMEIAVPAGDITVPGWNARAALQSGEGV